MRKMFRMKYEACTGQCYAHSDVMRIHTLGLDVKGAAEFLKRLLKMHGPSCGNNSIEFRLDEDTFYRKVPIENGYDDHVFENKAFTRFVASFWHYGTLDLFGGDTPLEALNKMIDAALAWYETKEGKELIERDSPPARASVCHHGTDEKLVEFAIEFSGLDEAGRKELRAQFA